MQEALFYEKGDDGRTFCRLCPRLCNIRDGHTGFCRVRKNQQGILYTLNYGRVSSYALDPIEKKPLYHFYPGSDILSLGSVGCNLRCGFCQNWQIAHADPHTLYLSPAQAVAAAKEQIARGYPNVGLAYTYNEPFMWYEYVYDTARLAREEGLKNVLVTNGYVNEEPLRQILPCIDAMNIDVKGFTDEYYRGTCAGHLEPVLRAVEIAHEHCHVELTTLLVPGLNDSEEEIRRLVDWVAGLDPDIPLHFSRYFPNYKFDLPPTPLETLQKAREIALEKLRYVYIGNAPELGGSDTLCPACGETLIRRTGYRVQVRGLAGNRCRYCGREVKLVVMK
ncbi:AmmeMemoRadiSam system radical SAM enzyme [Desulfofundulus thermosubterraneus]|uniref:Pyruvate formate lyase activating enzyme n=1 Tax=Desulfofundulus thermosubterraneus DSM 16057 TaxID=1121432 RepID=A0A1M6GT87_9FIRM|nr:AmmeMemoRadiSam system radical SAM enzyme [Desulfofundulus thermosubterraneus]SHJ13127.1 pyruvate formate lyase activating enzyme [Desulfofundulus thermosubterraneus DSM 16057]